MPIQKITIEEFLKLATQYPVLDVRSPGEYTHAHIPTAYSLPLFDDAERKQVGTAYKQQSREEAIKIGLDFFGVKMRKMVEEAESLIVNSNSLTEKELQTNNGQRATSNIVLVHCWRGGMRSAAVAWLLDMYGFKIYLLTGGYKAYRNWVLAQFEKEYSFNIIGGYTGSGKTLLLKELEKNHKTIIDLEGLANHKGSAFGALENIPQPGQEMFENMLAEALFVARCSLPEENDSNTNNEQQTTNNIYLEDESQRIGNLRLPMPIWHTMRKAPVFFIDIPFEERLDYITGDYGKQNKQNLNEAILRIQKRLGGLETKNALMFLAENNYRECFRILLSYYDKWYYKGLHNRENISNLLNKIPCSSVDTETNTQKLLSCNIVNV